MRDDYVPNEKYRNMFGVERNGYGMERVDLYLAQLEVAFKKIREDNRNLKRELTEQQSQGAPTMGGLLGNDSSMQLAAREQYIAQLQGQLADQQEQNQRLLMQLSDPALAAPPPQPQVDDLMNQIAALRAEADELRQQLRRQAAAPQPSYQQPFVPFGENYSDQRLDTIGKVLVEARQQAEEVKRAAKQEADQSLSQARRQADTIRAERDRIYSQLQGISYALRSALREAGEAEFKPNVNDFGALTN